MFQKYYIKAPSQKYELIHHLDSICILGSCFSEHIGLRLQSIFNTLINPFGTIYNPFSISDNIIKSIDLYEYQENEIFNNQDNKYFSFNNHSILDALSIYDAISKSNQALKTTNQFLKNANMLIITLGTAWVYQYIDTKHIVGNCHKMPQNQFKRFLMPLVQIINSIETMLNKLFEFNPNIKVVFTISPVRHTKEGLWENNVSKGLLHNAIYQIVDSKKSFYFPAYEIQNDVLRDYRFFESDLIHPNNQAINFIWDAFMDSMFDDKLIKEKEKINKNILKLFHIKK